METIASTIDILGEAIERWGTSQLQKEAGYDHLGNPVPVDSLVGMTAQGKAEDTAPLCRVGHALFHHHWQHKVEVRVLLRRP